MNPCQAIVGHPGELETIERFINEVFADPLSEEPPDDREVEPENLAENRSDPEAYAKFLLSKLEIRVAKQRESLAWRANAAMHGPQGEKLSSIIVQRVEWVPLRHIFDDPTFTNVRLDVDEEKLGWLVESMRHEGLKVPITVIAITDDHVGFYVRAGFRRTEAARRLGWRGIPAVILPANTPVVEEYWTNIVENTGRSQLSSYETARAAQVMRDKFSVRPREFATRAGYSSEYVSNLLRCVDRLPEEILDAWRERRPIPLSYLINWAALTPDEAIKMMNSYANRNPTITRGWTPITKQRRPLLIKMSSARGLQRMMRVRVAIELARDLDPKTRDLCLKLVDFCSGAREDVPAIFNPRDRQPRLARRREEVKLQLVEPEAPAPTKIQEEVNILKQIETYAIVPPAVETETEDHEDANVTPPDEEEDPPPDER